MKIASIFIIIVTASLFVAGGVFVSAPVLFSGRVAPGLQAGLHTLTGVSKKDVPAIVEAFDREIKGHVVTFVLGEQEVVYSLGEVGVALDKDMVVKNIQATSVIDVVSGQVVVEPVTVINEVELNRKFSEFFVEDILGPQNATLEFNEAGKLALVPSEAGEIVDTEKLKGEIKQAVVEKNWDEPIVLSLKRTEAQVQNDEVASALEYANQILGEGMELTFGEEVILVKPFTIRRLIRFVEQVDPNNHNNFILGVKFDSEELSQYLKTTVAPVIDRATQNARFVLNDERVEQFSLPEEGRKLNIVATAGNIAAKLAKHERVVELKVDITEPVFANLEDIEKLGLTNKLSTGVSDYIGSPSNRVHNIAVGAARYHGLLIPPGSEFSFNEILGPVNAATGFKQELVIKSNVTTPEYGGGLCQVSTTIFRAALNAGLEITQRRNHSYAVSYYGKPGLDATIYPPYTDLRFLNNTDGYILIQTRIEGTELAFDFWGTADDRQVEITGPVTYDRKANGAVSAYFDQRVTLAGEVIIDRTFYSRYKSPKLFPKVLAANGESMPEVNKKEITNQVTPKKDDISQSSTPKTTETSATIEATTGSN